MGGGYSRTGLHELIVKGHRGGSTAREEGKAKSTLHRSTEWQLLALDGGNGKKIRNRMLRNLKEEKKFTTKTHSKKAVGVFRFGADCN